MAIVKKSTTTLNPNSLDTICSALAFAMDIDAPEKAADKNADSTVAAGDIFEYDSEWKLHSWINL